PHFILERLLGDESLQNKNRIATYIERHERTCARIFGLTFVAGHFVSKIKKTEKNLQGWQEKQVLSIFELLAKGKSCGVILDEFLNAHDMIILAAPLTFI